MSFVLFNVAFTILGHIMMLPTCSNDLCMVLPYLNAMPQTRDMTSLHMTLYHGGNYNQHKGDSSQPNISDCTHTAQLLSSHCSHLSLHRASLLSHAMDVYCRL